MFSLTRPKQVDVGRKEAKRKSSMTRWGLYLPFVLLIAIFVLVILLQAHILSKSSVFESIYDIKGDSANISESSQSLSPLILDSSQKNSQERQSLRKYHNLSHFPVIPKNIGSSTQHRKRIGYAITITKDGFFQDGAAVLLYSILHASKINHIDKGYDISFIAFVHPNVQSSRPVLEQLGYRVIVAPTPVNVSAIRFEFLREKIEKNGCCGASELIKLSAYRLGQYDRIVHLDADTFMINSIDELFDRNYSLIYSTDPNMASYKGVDQMPVQGGFLVLKPSEQDYRNLINIVLTTEFVSGSGWNASTIGWYWGGMTVQGVLPYYYNAITSRGRSQVIDRCIYNTMADTDECLTKTLDMIKSAHFTVCQKPWACTKDHYNPLCKKLHLKWFELRKLAEQFYGVPVTANACPHGGHKFYKPMQLENARIPSLPGLVPDDSPSFLKPTEESRFISEDYDMSVGGKYANLPENAPLPAVKL